MKIRKLLTGLVIATLASAGLVSTSAGPAVAAGPNDCSFAGTMTLEPGVNAVPPSTPSGYRFHAVVVCEGTGGMQAGNITSTGTYHGDGSFVGSLSTSFGCNGGVSGTRVGPVLVGNANAGSCGSGPFVILFLPTGTNGGVPPLITSAAIYGVATLL